MPGCLFLLALFIPPSALQQPTTEDLKNYVDYTLGKVNDIKALIAENKVDLENTLKEVVDEAVDVKA